MVYHFWQEKLMLAVGRQSETIIIVKRNLLSIWLFFFRFSWHFVILHSDWCCVSVNLALNESLECHKVLLGVHPLSYLNFLQRTRLDAARVTLLEGIKMLNKLIPTMSKKFTLAVPSHFCFARSLGITHSHFCEGLHMHLPYW